MLSQALLAYRETLYKMYPEYASNYGNEQNTMVCLRGITGTTLTTVNREATLLPVNGSLFS